MAKKKFYVVWKGVEPGVYDSWDDCRAQVNGFDGAVYKSFTSRTEAEEAFNDSPWEHLQSNKKPKSNLPAPLPSDVIRQSLAVDAACSGNPGRMEYRGVWVEDNLEMFHVGPVEDGTNNVGEFLAIVHALALLQNDDRSIPIYSDSANAIKWVKNKKCNTKLKPTKQNGVIFEWIARAERWLRTHRYTNPILKWETKQWGEIPADFGRK